MRVPVLRRNKCFCITTHFALKPLAEGFRDSHGHYLTQHLHRGVWLSDCPLDVNEGADGDTYLILDIPEETVNPYEWIEEGKGYREFLVPADVVNRFGPPKVLTDEEYYELGDHGHWDLETGLPLLQESGFWDTNNGTEKES